jgi:putative transposase
VFGAPPNSVKNNQKEYIQLSLFDWARYENPTPLA